MRGSLRLVAVVAVVQAGGGCAQIAGIDKTNGDNRQVSLVLDRLSIGAKVSSAPLVLDALTATYLVPDATDATLLAQLPAMAPSAGLWAAKLQSGTPPVLFTLPDGAAYLWALSSRTMHGVFAALEHPDPTPPPTGASITVDGTLNTPVVAGETFQFLDVGSWARLALPTPAVGATTVGPTTFAYATVANLAAPLPLAGMTPDDVVLVLRHAGGALTGIGELTPAGPQGATTAINAPIAAVSRNQTLAMPIEPAAFAARFTGQKPAPTGAVTMPWTVVAAPAFAHGNTSGPVLLQGTATAAETSLAGTYGNPFATTHMWPSALTFSAVRTRTYAPGGAAGPQLGLTTRLNQLLAPDGTAPLALPAPLPLQVTVGITPLAADDTSVLIDASKPVPVSFTTDGMPAELFELQLYELVASGATFTMTLKLTLAADAPSWQIPASFLAPAHRYVFRAITVSGAFQGVDTGDLSTVTVPYTTGTLDGGVFTVTL